jgi:hypothetical protein
MRARIITFICRHANISEAPNHNKQTHRPRGATQQSGDSRGQISFIYYAFFASAHTEPEINQILSKGRCWGRSTHYSIIIPATWAISVAANIKSLHAECPSLCNYARKLNFVLRYFRSTSSACKRVLTNQGIGKRKLLTHVDLTSRPSGDIFFVSCLQLPSIYFTPLGIFKLCLGKI